MAEFRWPKPSPEPLLFKNILKEDWTYLSPPSTWKPPMEVEPPKWESIYYPEYNAVQYIVEVKGPWGGPFYLVDDRFFGDQDWHEYDDGDTIIRGEN